MQQGREELANTPDNTPVLGKQKFEKGFFFVGRAAPVYCHRDQQQLAILVVARLDDLTQASRTFRSWPSDNKSPLRAQHDKASGKAFATIFESPRGRRQPMLLTGTFERQ